MNEPNPTNLNTREELVGFFRDLIDQPGFEFRGLTVEIHRVGALKHLSFILVLPVIFQIMERISGLKSRKQGSYLRFVFPDALAADLLLSSSRENGDSDISFDECFYIDAADLDTVQTFLTEEMRIALLELNRRYFVRMTDYYIEFGPIVGRPEDSADDVLLLVDALPQLKIPNADVSSELDFGGIPFVVVKTVSSNVQANLLKLELESRGIPCRLLHGAQCAIWGHTNTILGVQVSVPESDYEEAVEIINYQSQEQ